MPRSSQSAESPPETAGPAPPRIFEAEDGDAGRWNAFLAVCPNANFYQRYEWLSVNRRLLGHRTTALLAEKGGQITGVLPLVHVKSRLFGHIVSSMPFVNFGGVAAVDEGTEAALVDAACRHAVDSQCDYMEIRSDRPLDGMRAATDKVSMTVPLQPDPELVFERFSSKHRRNIRRAYSNDIEVRSGGAELLDSYFELLSLSWRQLGTPLYRKDYFAAILAEAGDAVRIFVAYHGNRPIATAMNGHFRGTVEGMWAGADPRYRHLQPNYVLYAEMIRYACRRGMQRFHLGRSTAGSAAQQFKARWSAEPKPLFWNYHLVQARNMPDLNPDNPRYALAIRAWQRLPLAFTRAVGPHIARFIP